MAHTLRVLITGAGGFSGSQLVPTLVTAGHNVVAMAGRNGLGRLQIDPSRNGKITVIEGDLAQELNYPGYVDAIVHTAAVSPGPQTRVSDFIQSNVEATRRLVRWARRQGVRTFINFSSLSVFGRIESPIVDESTPRIEPDAYGVSKWLGEQILANESTDMHSLSLRLPGIIGPRPVRNWLTTVMAAAKEGREISYYHPNADFNNAVHIQDLCRCIVSLLSREWSGHDMIALGGADTIKVREVVSAISAGFGGRARLREVASARCSFTICIARAQKLYDYQPMAMRDMIAQFISENQEGTR